MKTVGVGGPPGSGKSAVIRLLSRRKDVRAIDLDRVAWGVYRPGTPCFAALVAEFGLGILGDDGAVDRRLLAEQAFATESRRQRLHTIVHPAVNEWLQRRLSEETPPGTAVLLVEGALLGISPHVDYSLFDAVVWLDAPPAVLAARLAVAGRRGHLERWRVHPFVHRVIRIDAVGTIEEVGARLMAAVERLPARE